VKKIIILLFVCIHVNAQFLEDSESRNQAKIGLDYLYNLEYEKAENTFETILVKYHNHPVSYLIKATLLQWKNMPIEKHPAAFSQYISLLEKCSSSAYELYKNGFFKTEATFYLLSSHGNISRGYHYNNDYIKAGWEAKKAYVFLKEGLQLADTNPDFLFTNGLFKFYRTQYPISHPQIKPIIYFFAEGNKAEGLNDLRRASKTALFTKTESAFFLAGICMKYENRNAEALTLLSKLYKNYSRNPDFLLKYTESLIANNQLDKAKEMNALLKKVKGVDYQLASMVFGAQLTSDNREAEKIRRQALEIKGDGRYTRDIRSMLFLDLGEVAYARKDLISAKRYFKECLEIAEYTIIKKRAQGYLNKL
jgi:Tfp pilus assembly protein PilF